MHYNLFYQRYKNEVFFSEQRYACSKEGWCNLREISLFIRKPQNGIFDYNIHPNKRSFNLISRSIRDIVGSPKRIRESKLPHEFKTGLLLIAGIAETPRS